MDEHYKFDRKKTTILQRKQDKRMEAKGCGGQSENRNKRDAKEEHYNFLEGLNEKLQEAITTRINETDQHALVRPVTNEEIERTVFNLKKGKEPRHECISKKREACEPSFCSWVARFALDLNRKLPETLKTESFRARNSHFAVESNVDTSIINVSEVPVVLSVVNGDLASVAAGQGLPLLVPGVGVDGLGVLGGDPLVSIV
ncbi:hypothetical protein LIER_32656 [Lithospermum erythrorhizon]|uniref:Uncharacterized protein n=1 Tax=Lithospermum erythrorhizon TaxID=34254 RepID=A0AAV3RUF7_LITER